MVVALFSSFSYFKLVFARYEVRDFPFSAGEKISGIQYNPESIHGMRENLERIL